MPNSSATDVGAILRGEPPTGRAGQVSVAVYLVACIASVAWSLSGPHDPGKDLGAMVHWQAVGSGPPSMVILNNSGEDWTEVRVLLDQRYYTHLDQIADGRTAILPLSDFSDSQSLPRAYGLFAYELSLPRPATASVDALPSWYQPSEIQMQTDQGRLLVTPSEP